MENTNDQGQTKFTHFYISLQYSTDGQWLNHPKILLVQKLEYNLYIRLNIYTKE